MKQRIILTLLVFLFLVLFSSSACTISETEKHARELGLTDGCAKSVRDLPYDAFTRSLIKEISYLPAEAQASDIILNGLGDIAADRSVTSSELVAFRDIDGDGLDNSREKELGTDPVRPNPCVKYALDNGLPYIPEMKLFDRDGVMDDSDKKTIDLAVAIGKRSLSEELIKTNTGYLLSDYAGFEKAYIKLKGVSDKALENMLGLGINGNVADYIAFVSQLPDKGFAGYALESRLCIDDGNLEETERAFLREPDKYTTNMFDDYMSRIEKANPELAMELKKLPDFQQVEMRDVEGLEDIMVAAQKPGNKQAFDLMLNEGIKDKRKYCSPLEALLWIAYDREFNDTGLVDYNNFSFKDFSIDKLIKAGWLYTKESNAAQWDGSKEFISVDSTVNDDNISFDTLLENIFREKAIPNALKSDGWKDFNIVIDRLNSPQLVFSYQKYTFSYEFIGKWMRDNTPAKDFFPLRRGACMDYAAFVAYCLETNGYPYVRGMELHFDRFAMGCFGHIVCIYKNPGEDAYYIIDNAGPSHSGPYKSEKEAAEKTCFIDTKGLAKLTYYNIGEIDLATGRFH